ncbi:MAG: GNAT family N-acetyltransferase [Synergistaceae bacterium]|jgi:GNAT superfamily N-acetyltransferase|nr:GNAT family N-acetyltransferase [Synergistaceae bacterium]
MSNAKKFSPSDAGRQSVLLNLRSLVRLVGAMDSSRFLETDGCVCCDSGTGSAHENYALLAPGIDEGTARQAVHDALAFFAETDSPHVWPIFPGVPEDASRELDMAGARWEGTYYGMTAPTDAMKSPSPETQNEPYELSGPEEIRDWADAVWYGFDSGEPAPENFKRYARKLFCASGVRLYAVKQRENEESPPVISSTGLLCETCDSAGIYYISTRPEFRRRGLGMSVINFLVRLVLMDGYDKISLLATPSGRPMYLRCGFRETERVRMGVIGES